MARRHKGIIAIGAIIVGVAIIGAGVIGTIGTAAFGWIAGEEEAVMPTPASGFPVSVAKAAPVEKPRPPREPPPTKNDQREVPTGNKQPPPKTQTELWWEGVNKGGMHTAEFDNKHVAGGGGGSYGAGGCNITQPVQVYAMLAMNATTDEPGLTIGGISEDIQGEMLGGELCVAVPMGSIVTMTVAGAGEYATSKAPVTVDEIYLPSIDGAMGEVIKVGQKAAAYDGVPGIDGKADHHIVSRTFAGIASVLFRVADNATRFGSVNVSSGDATDPLANTLQKTLDRPSEIVLSKSGYGFTLMPTTTIGY